MEIVIPRVSIMKFTSIYANWQKRKNIWHRRLLENWLNRRKCLMKKGRNERLSKNSSKTQEITMLNIILSRKRISNAIFRMMKKRIRNLTTNMK